MGANGEDAALGAADPAADAPVEDDPGPATAETASPELKAEIREIARKPDQTRELDSLPDPFADLKRKDLQQDIDLKRMYAIAVLGGLGIQTAIADYFFYRYGQGVKWQISSTVMSTWTSATVVEVVGIVLVVTRYLFPRRDQTPGS